MALQIPKQIFQFDTGKQTNRIENFLIFWNLAGFHTQHARIKLCMYLCLSVNAILI